MAVKRFESEELARLESILAQLDLKASELRDAIRGTGARDLTTLETDLEAILAKLDVTLSNVRDTLDSRLYNATDAQSVYDHLKTVATRLDITLSALRDALRGTGTKDFTTLEADVEDVAAKLGNATGWQHGYITVSTPGTPVQGPDVPIAPGKAVALVYYPKNTGEISIGASSSGAVHPDNGGTGEPILLTATGQSMRLQISNLNLIWVDATVAGDKLMWFVEV